MSATANATAVRVCDIVAEALVESGVTSIFGLMGEDTAPLAVAAVARGIAYYPVRHENQAVAMADGYSRATGRTGVAAITSGPGFANALNAITTAHRAGSSVLVLCGAGLPSENDHDQSVIRTVSLTNYMKFYPQATILAPLGVETVRPLDGAAAGAHTLEALQKARDRTVVLLLNRHLLLEQAQADGDQPADTCGQLEPRAPGPEEISGLADLLQETWAIKRPMILAGRGAVASGAGPALRRLGELTGAILSTTLPARTFFDGDPYDIGICGTFSTPVASELIAQADCVLAFGASLNAFTTYYNSLFAKALLVHIDTRESALERFQDAELAIQADVRLVAEALVSELESRDHSAVGFRLPENRDAIAGYRPDEPVDRSTPDLLDPATLMVELDRMLPAERIICIDAGNFTHFAVTHISVRQPRNWMQILDGGSIGLGLGAGIGAAVGRPETVTVVALGDAAMMMSLGDLESAVRLRLPILVVIGNDQALGSEVNILSDLGFDPELARIPSPSFEAIARAMGAQAATVRSIGDLAVVDEWLRTRAETPLVLDCRVDPTIRGFTVTTQFKPPSSPD